MTSRNDKPRGQAGFVGAEFGYEHEQLNGSRPPILVQDLRFSRGDSVDDLDFARDLVAFSGADHLLAVARYDGGADGAHIEVFGPMPRGWRQMIPSRARHRDLPRILWRNSRGKKTHPVDFTHVAELAAELVEQRAARRAA